MPNITVDSLVVKDVLSVLTRHTVLLDFVIASVYLLYVRLYTPLRRSGSLHCQPDPIMEGLHDIDGSTRARHDRHAPRKMVDKPLRFDPSTSAERIAINLHQQVHLSGLAQAWRLELHKPCFCESKELLCQMRQEE